MKIPGLLGALLTLCGLIVAPVWAWRFWRWRRLLRRRAMFRVLADDLGLTCFHGDQACPQPLRSTTPPEVDAHIGGHLQGMCVDIYERLLIERSQGVPTETETVVEISGLCCTFPTFRLMPADSHDRAIHKVLGTRKIVVPEDLEFCARNTLTGRDKAGIEALFRNGVAELLRNNTDLWTVSTGESLRFSRYEKLLPPDDIRKLLSQALNVANTVRDAARWCAVNSPLTDTERRPRNKDGLLSWWTPNE